ncbi:MAG: hypothetical protein GQ565_10690 [Candidatus Aegiribacteria sp.]|nr:hypothetical protein [Candidatus Aegiribacteria sp.]
MSMAVGCPEHHRKLMPKLCGCAWDALTIFLHEALDRRDVFPGGILVPQTFGGMAVNAARVFHQQYRPKRIPLLP